MDSKEDNYTFYIELFLNITLREHQVIYYFYQSIITVATQFNFVMS